jgi:hypothetical protein
VASGAKRETLAHRGGLFAQAGNPYVRFAQCTGVRIHRDSAPLFAHGATCKNRRERWPAAIRSECKGKTQFVLKPSAAVAETQAGNPAHRKMQGRTSGGMTTRETARDDDAIARDDGAALTTLARRPDLPPRVRALLDELLTQTRTYFATALPKTLDELEDALFTLAERSGSNTLQQKRFEALRAIKHGRAEVTPRFLRHVEATLARVRSPQRPKPAQRTTTSPDQTPLELVDTSVLDENLALREIASKSEIRHSQALYALSRRLGVLAAAPAWPNATLPLGPAQFSAAFRDALEKLELDADSRVLAYREFDRVAMLPMGSLYDGLNACLIAQRILPNLRRHAHVTHRNEGATPVAPAATPVATQAHEAQPASAAGLPAAPPAHPPSVPREDATDAALFGTLRSLLGERRRREEGYPASRSPSFHADRDELQTVLGALQHKPADDSGQTLHDSEYLKNTLMVKLRRASPQGRPLDLSEEDADTVDLVGMLFDYISSHISADGSARSLLTRLHVPVLRVALNDKTFFTRHDHPARALLNTLAETGTHWTDETEADPDLAQRMQLVVDRVSADFDGDIGVFDTLLGDLNQHMQLLARRAEMVERRQIEAAEGRDKLEVARQTAHAAVARIVEGSTPSPVVRVLLEQAWTDALALSVLRRGTDSNEYRRRVVVAEKIAQLGATPSAQPVDKSLRDDLDSGLRQIGLHDDELASILDGVFPAPHTAPLVAQEAQQRVGSALSRTIRLGGTEKSDPVAKPTTAPAAMTAAESAALEQLHKIPFGTWFEFVTNQQGQSVRRKLAWYSTLTGRCLFVNQRGARTGDKTLDLLARDMARGQVRPILDKQGSLIDRAWNAIVDALRPQSAAATKKAP